MSWLSWNKPEASDGRGNDQMNDNIVIVVMGETGCGKSTFINRASGRATESVGDGLKSYTNDVDSVEFLDRESGRSIVLVDTPGFNGVSLSDRDVLDKVLVWLDNSRKQGKNLSAILYLHRITDNRMEGTPIQKLLMFQKLCGNNALDKVYFATTMWDSLGQNEPGEERMNELQFESWNMMIAQGSHVLQTRCHNMNADDVSAKQIIWEILEQLDRAAG
ncbi:P-loop containing nucleoside triphosphate hydrolase protein [Chiua virens]|nr:P-loop containing nucleoside triphosphate hydrolase protein [Chiua virens]